MRFIGIGFGETICNEKLDKVNAGRILATNQLTFK
jgi:hypothetical protein